MTLPAIDVAASVAFYQCMGFELIVDAPHYARFKSMEGDTTFSVHKVDLLVEASQTVVYFETSSLDETVKRLQRKGFVLQPSATRRTVALARGTTCRSFRQRHLSLLGRCQSSRSAMASWSLTLY